VSSRGLLPNSLLPGGFSGSSRAVVASSCVVSTARSGSPAGYPFPSRLRSNPPGEIVPTPPPSSFRPLGVSGLVVLEAMSEKCCFVGIRVLRLEAFEPPTQSLGTNFAQGHGKASEERERKNSALMRNLALPKRQGGTENGLRLRSGSAQKAEFRERARSQLQLPYVMTSVGKLSKAGCVRRTYKNS
jgi:hypothetical protein